MLVLIKGFIIFKFFWWPKQMPTPQQNVQIFDKYKSRINETKKQNFRYN
jgi:hypothetical protein